MKPVELLNEYFALHDGLSDMIESGRLKREDIPDDYLWLVETLERLTVESDMMASRYIKFGDLRVGETFQFHKDGEVYVRSRGGFRRARGGPLYTERNEASVLRHFSCHKGSDANT